MSDRLSQEPRHVYSQRLHLRLTDVVQERLIEHAEHWNDRTPLWLRDELGDDTNVIEQPFRIGKTHDAAQPVHRAKLARMVVP